MNQVEIRIPKPTLSTAARPISTQLNCHTVTMYQGRLIGIKLLNFVTNLLGCDAVVYVSPAVPQYGRFWSIQLAYDIAETQTRIMMPIGIRGAITNYIIVMPYGGCLPKPKPGSTYPNVACQLRWISSMLNSSCLIKSPPPISWIFLKLSFILIVLPSNSYLYAYHTLLSFLVSFNDPLTSPKTRWLRLSCLDPMRN